ncbi:MAG: hypothetical protein RI897_3498 [Verrucomicrobiota bacterium]
MFFGDTATGGAAGLGGFEGMVIGDTAADFEDDLAEGHTHGDFDEAGIFDFAGEGEAFGAGGFWRAEFGVPFAAFGDDGGDVGVSFDVIDERGFTPEAEFGGVGGAWAGLAAAAFDGGEQGGFFAADEGAGADADFDIEVKSCIEDIFTDEGLGAGLFDGEFESFDSEGVFGADVEEAFLGTDGVGGDGHTFDDAVGVTFEDAAVHEGAGVAFVAVTDDVFFVTDVFIDCFPFEAGGVAGAAAAAEAGLFEFGDDFFG